MEKPKKSNLPSQRRLGSLDVKKSSSSLNMSTSSLRSINEDRESTIPVGRRSTVVRLAPTPPPPPPSSSTTTRRRSSLSVSQEAKTRPAAARPASASGLKCRSSAGGLPESGPKAMRRSWGWKGSAGEEMENGDLSTARSRATATQVRSCSVPRRMPTEEKPLQKRESKTKITSRTTAKSNPSPKPDVLHKPGKQRSPNNIASKTSERAHGSVSLNNMVKVSPPRRTSAETMSTSWESLPSDLQSLGSETMSYRDAAEMAAVQALQEASAAEIVLRCLSAFADLAASTFNQSPQQTVDEFLALQAAVTRSTAVLGDQQHGGHARDWLHAAVTADLAPFSLYTAPSSPPRKSSRASPAVSPPATTLRGEAAAEETWLETTARELGEEMCAWFVGYVERLLDADVAGTLGQLKRVNDWLDAVGARSEAAERLRKKIFGYLLDHVESAVFALNGGVVPSRRK